MPYANYSALPGIFAEFLKFVKDMGTADQIGRRRRGEAAQEQVHVLEALRRETAATGTGIARDFSFLVHLRRRTLF